jgi:hypothetical protein
VQEQYYLLAVVLYFGKMPCGDLNFQLVIPVLNCYLMTLLVLRLDSYDDRMDIKQAAGGIRIGRKDLSA